jgi:outer membrane protein OmpA-like peptidoglycan-associated protein
MADAATKGSSVGGAVLTAFLVLVTVGGAVAAGYWFVVKPQLDTQSRTLVTLELNSQDLGAKVDGLAERLGAVDGQGAGGGGTGSAALEALTERLDAIEAAARGNAERIDALRTEVLAPMAEDVSMALSGQKAAAATDRKPAADTATAMLKPRVGTGLLPIGSTPAAVVRFPKIGDTGGAWLAKAMQDTLPALRKAVAGKAACTLFVIGHADRLGPQALNERIGFQRAENVRATLEILFVDDDDFETVTFQPSVSLGERDPAVGTDDEVANKTNRRVELHVSCKGDGAPMPKSDAAQAGA